VTPAAAWRQREGNLFTDDAQAELRGVVEGLTLGIDECGTLFGEAGVVEHVLLSSTAHLVGSSTASMRRMTHIGKMTYEDLPHPKRSRGPRRQFPHMKEAILLCRLGPLSSWHLLTVVYGLASCAPDALLTGAADINRVRM
jgi:hypothetical protein